MSCNYPTFARRGPATPLFAGLFVLGLLGSAPASAADDAPPADDAEPPISIHATPDTTIEEYRINGKLYMIRITPKKGAPYYLVDADGDGELETRSNELAPDFLIPSWVIFKW